MKVEAKCGIHNRFDIEVRDAVTGELKRTAYAENMILDRGFERVLNFQSYFTNIHFGKGTGAITPSRTTLFNSLGYKTAEVVEQDYSLPTAKVVKKIQINPDEFVGETFTEVGISNSTTLINTHALIKDAEGNDLALTKQPLEVLIIYATVFVTLNNANGVSFSVAENNLLLKYFLEQSAVTTSNSYISLGSSNIDSPAFIGLEENFKAPVITRDISKKELYFSNRFEIQEGNGNIREVGLFNVLRSKIPDIYPPVNLSDFVIGVGDGTSVEFEYFPETSNVIIKLNDVITNDYNVVNDSYLTGEKKHPLPAFVDINEEYTENLFYDYPFLRGVNNDYGVSSDLVRIQGASTYYFKAKQSLKNKIFGFGAAAGGGISPWGGRIRIASSPDGETYSNNVFTIISSSSGTLYSEIINTDDLWFRIILDHTGSGNPSYVYFCCYLENPTPTKIVFDDPPPSGAKITADFTVPYIPKSSDYILDVEFTLQFGEGV